jgi:hypothetical protein
MYSLSSCHLKLFYTACFIAGVFKAYSADSLKILVFKGCDKKAYGLVKSPRCSK